MPAPDKATEIKAAVTAIVAFLTALWGSLGWAVLTMIWAMLADYLTGSWAAKMRGEWASSVAREGLWHKLGEIVALMVAAMCDISLQVILSSAAAPIFQNGTEVSGGYLTMLVSIWYIFTELGSILENLQLMGVPIPSWLVQGVKKGKEQADKFNSSASESDTKPTEVGKHERR